MKASNLSSTGRKNSAIEFDLPIEDARREAMQDRLDEIVFEQFHQHLISGDTGFDFAAAYKAARAKLA